MRKLWVIVKLVKSVSVTVSMYVEEEIIYMHPHGRTNRIDRPKRRILSRRFTEQYSCWVNSVYRKLIHRMLI